MMIPVANAYANASTSNRNSSSSNNNHHALTPSITYIPQLIDGACGTMPHAQRSVLQRLRYDLSTATRLLPTLVHAAVVARVHVVEMLQHVGLALLEAVMLLAAVPLWLCLPGIVFLAWLGVCGALVAAASWSLNGGSDGAASRGRIVKSVAPAADEWMMMMGGGGKDEDACDERWFYVGGMGTSASSLSRKTLPALSKLFNRSIEAVHMPTYGLPLDFLALLLQRCLGPGSASVLSTRHSRALYAQIRTAVLDKGTSRTVILAHNTGAVTVAQILHQLYADISAHRLATVEVYTFGAAAADFSLPLNGISPSMQPGHPAGHGSAENDLGHASGTKQNKRQAIRANSDGSYHYHHHHHRQQQQQVHVPELIASSKGPHIEHFAFANDPFAKMGVLRSVHEDLEGRFCGSVFEMDCPGAAHHGGGEGRGRGRVGGGGGGGGFRLGRTELSTPSRSRLMMSLDDYLNCLFPEYGNLHRGSGGGGSTPMTPSPTSSRPRCHRSRGHWNEMPPPPQQQQHPTGHHHNDHYYFTRVESNDSTHPSAFASGGGGSILNTLMLVDRDLAEKREFAALAQHSASVRSKGSKKRLSWTGLGATVGTSATGNMDGVLGLEMARKGCRNCQGHRGRDVTWLARYVVGLPADEVEQAREEEEEEVEPARDEGEADEGAGAQGEGEMLMEDGPLFDEHGGGGSQTAVDGFQ